MQISKIQSANNVNFNARFIENAKYKELYQYAKQQKTFPKFEKVIKHLETLPDYLVTLDYGKTKIQQDCDYGGMLKLGLVPCVEKHLYNSPEMVITSIQRVFILRLILPL